MDVLDHGQQFLAEMRAARVSLVRLGDRDLPVRVISRTGQPDIWIGPIAFQRLKSLVAFARHVVIEMPEPRLDRRVPQFGLRHVIEPHFFSFPPGQFCAQHCLIWQSGHHATELRVAFFGGREGKGALSWLTHEVVVHVPASRAPEARIEPSDSDLQGTLLIQAMNASARLDDGDRQWVEIVESEFRDRAAGEGIPLPITHLDVLQSILHGVFVRSGALEVTGYAEPKYQETSVAVAMQNVQQAQSRGPIAAEKFVPEHWVLGTRKPGGEECLGICVVEYSDPRHGHCLDCGRKTWLRKSAIHTPGGKGGMAPAV